MQYFSLNGQSPTVSFREAALLGQAPDKGLYFPSSLPVIDRQLIEAIDAVPVDELSLRIMSPYVGHDIPEGELRRIVRETLGFPIPLVPVGDAMYSLELFHGPTLAFKDVGARFMSRCLAYFSGEERRHTVVLVATSGDTGSAVADGFYGVEGVDVVILFPSGKVSPVQELQLTTHGKNIHAVEIDGDFDACQSLVKEAFADPDLQARIRLTSANSINVARWLPQQLYYMLAYRQWPNKRDPPVICVPSGNFGNICAGMLAWATGLPVAHFIAACNENDTIPRYLATGNYVPRVARATISNAMDVSEPSNFVRIMQIAGKDPDRLKSILTAVRIDEDETRETIARVYRRLAYLLDPHGAVAYAALAHYLQEHRGQQGIFLETAHPVKFPDVVEAVTGEKIPMPAAVSELFRRSKKSHPMPAKFGRLKEFLLNISTSL